MVLGTHTKSPKWGFFRGRSELTRWWHLFHFTVFWSICFVRYQFFVGSSLKSDGSEERTESSGYLAKSLYVSVQVNAKCIMYGWWKKSCTSWHGKYPSIYKVLLHPRWCRISSTNSITESHIDILWRHKHYPETHDVFLTRTPPKNLARNIVCKTPTLGVHVRFQGCVYTNIYIYTYIYIWYTNVYVYIWVYNKYIHNYMQVWVLLLATVAFRRAFHFF